MAFALGIDIGGTTTKGAYCSPEGQVQFSFEIPTPKDSDSRATHLFASSLAQQCAINQVLPNTITHLGVAVAGGINRQGDLILSPNLNLDLKKFDQALTVAFPNANKVFLNDANAATLGEVFAGAAKGYQTAIMLTIGTGIGAGVLIDGFLTEGAQGLAGEIGHLCVQPEGRICNCGRRGCLEQYASATALVRMYHEYADEHSCGRVTKPANARAVFEAFERGDEAAAFAVSEFCDKLAFGLAQLACVVDPDAFVIGGGVSLGHQHYEDLLKVRFAHHAGPHWAKTPLLYAQLGGNAGCIGAAACIQSRDNDVPADQADPTDGPMPDITAPLKM